MKVLLSIAILFVFACSNNSSTGERDTGKMHSTTTNTFDTSAKIIDLNGCYQMTLNRDTATMQLLVADTVVTGNLIYDWNEKDGNKGSIKGVLRDSLIHADYTFESEGMTSVREVIFKISDTLMKQAVGDLDEQNNKIIYKDKTKLDFNTMPAFIKVACPQHK